MTGKRRRGGVRDCRPNTPLRFFFRERPADLRARAQAAVQKLADTFGAAGGGNEEVWWRRAPKARPSEKLSADDAALFAAWCLRPCTRSGKFLVFATEKALRWPMCDSGQYFGPCADSPQAAALRRWARARTRMRAGTEARAHLPLRGRRAK